MKILDILLNFDIESFLEYPLEFEEKCSILNKTLQKKHKNILFPNKKIFISNKLNFVNYLLNKLSSDKKLIFYYFNFKFINHYTHLLEELKNDLNLQYYILFYLLTGKFSKKILDKENVKDEINKEIVITNSSFFINDSLFFSINIRLKQVKNIWNPIILFENTSIAKYFWEILNNEILNNEIIETYKKYNKNNLVINSENLNELNNILNIILDSSYSEFKWFNLKNIFPKTLYNFLINETINGKKIIISDKKIRNDLFRFQTIYNKYK